MNLKPVAFLLGLPIAPPAFAIGLGELSVQSSLGQPLQATVEVLNAPATLDAECMGLHSSDNNLPMLVQPRLRVERRGDNALLHITTPRAVSEPIAQFVLTSDCEGRLEREYVLLLDPPTQIESAGLIEAQATPGGNTAASKPAAAASSPAGPALTPAARKPPRRTATPKPTAVAIEPATRARTQAAPAQPERAAAAKPKAATAAPRLVISGKHSQSGSLPAGVEGAAPNARPPGLTSTELSDENTALSHRLAHLELQIAALHKRNAELEALLSAPALATALPQPAAPQTSPWPFYLIGAGLFTLSGVLFAGIRRRREPPPVAATGATAWARPSKAMPAKARSAPASALSRPDAMWRKNSPPRPSEDQDIAELSLSTLAKRTEVKEDILNQAEVFVAHGYTNVAINLLQEYLHEWPAASPMPWLLLLDLLQHSGDTAGYAAASAECRRHFNVNFPARPALPGQEDPRGLENYPHILDMLTQSWNTPKIQTLFKDLIYDQRNGVRMGFAPDAYRDILLLSSIAQDKALLSS